MEAPAVDTGTVEAPTPSPAPAQRRSRTGLDIVLAIAVAVAIGGVAFAAGRATAPSVATPGSGTEAGGGVFPPAGAGPNGVPGAGGFRGDDGGGGGGFGGFGGRLGGLTVRGTVTAVGNGTITIQLSSGATVMVGTDGTTTYHQQVAGSSTDVANGKQVIVQLGGTAGPPANGAPGNVTARPLGTASDVTVIP
jgi:hypothetical protein